MKIELSTPSLVVAGGLTLLCLSACGEIEPEPPVDDDGEPVDLPAPLEDWLFFERFYPDDEISTRPTIEIEFNEYLDPDSFNSFGVARLQSGGLIYFGRVDYRMTDKTLLFRTNTDIEADLTYELSWTADDIESVVGSPLHPEVVPPRYESRADLDTSPPVERPSVPWSQVEQLFESHCNDCHGETSRGLPELTPDGLVGRRSEQVDAMLVEPFHPARSYLMHKILSDYPIRRFTVQPPPWSEQEPLSTTDIERIEHWIAAGAPR